MKIADNEKEENGVNKIKTYASFIWLFIDYFFIEIDSNHSCKSNLFYKINLHSSISWIIGIKCTGATRHMTRLHKKSCGICAENAKIQDWKNLRWRNHMRVIIGEKTVPKLQHNLEIIIKRGLVKNPTDLQGGLEDKEWCEHLKSRVVWSP